MIQYLKKADGILIPLDNQAPLPILRPGEKIVWSIKLLPARCCFHCGAQALERREG